MIINKLIIKFYNLFQIKFILINKKCKTHQKKVIIKKKMTSKIMDKMKLLMTPFKKNLIISKI